MSILDRWFGKTEAQPIQASSASAPPLAAAVTPERTRSPPDEPPIDAKVVADIVRVEETAQAEFFAGDLFRRRFGSEPPDYPRHYVAFYRQARTRYEPVGYIHYSPYEDSFLCGGMVIDDRLYRRMPAAHRKLIKDAGGIAEIMLRATFARLRHAPAIWGYVGDKLAEEVDVRAGFRHTHHPHVMVVWNHELADADKAARLARIIALGPF